MRPLLNSFLPQRLNHSRLHERFEVTPKPPRHRRRANKDAYFNILFLRRFGEVCRSHKAQAFVDYDALCMHRGAVPGISRQRCRKVKRTRQAHSIWPLNFAEIYGKLPNVIGHGDRGFLARANI
ncbi:hypothetical protein BH09PLA1_BH09PLA1_00050 [soil metagenome]